MSDLKIFNIFISLIVFNETAHTWCEPSKPYESSF